MKRNVYYWILPKYAYCLSEEPFFNQIKKEIDEKKFLVISGVEAFKGFLDQMVRELARS